jgi:hypothetical protein
VGAHGPRFYADNSAKRSCRHDADQFEAFRKLADEGKGEEEIAARFGVTAHVAIAAR